MARNFTLPLPADFWIGDTVPVNAGDKPALPGQFAATGRPYLEFKDGADEYAAISKPFRMPAEYTGSGTLKLSLCWCSGTDDDTKKVNWEVQVEAVTDTDSIGLSTQNSFDAANDDGGTAVEATGYYPIVTPITLANKDSVQAGDLVRLLLRRDSDDATDDTAPSSAFLFEAELYEET